MYSGMMIRCPTSVKRMLEDVIASSLDLTPSDFVYNLMKELRDYQKRDSFNDDICVICMDL